MNQLLEIGFEPAGRWLLNGDRLQFELTRHAAQTNILYAFVCDGDVKYVGKTVRPLSVRMSGYRTPGKTQTTNIANHHRIRERLESGADVEIFALPDRGLLHYGPFHLNLAAGLEDDIIRVMDPEWNGGKKELIVERDAPAGDDAGSEAPVVQSFAFTLHPTYYRTGFFNVGVAAEGLLGGDGDTIELFLGAGSKSILGTINRRANTNGTPRIMGGTGVRDWFQANASVMDTVTVEVLSPSSIRLRLKRFDSAVTLSSALHGCS